MTLDEYSVYKWHSIILDERFQQKQNYKQTNSRHFENLFGGSGKEPKCLCPLDGTAEDCPPLWSGREVIFFKTACSLGRDDIEQWRKKRTLPRHPYQSNLDGRCHSQNNEESESNAWCLLVQMITIGRDDIMGLSQHADWIVCLRSCVRLGHAVGV